ncbi:MAG: hypothetical protein PVF70_02525 [Anaerolineales bacterium]|jgi:hypothetical protein
MLVAKQVADAITVGRMVVIPLLIWVGATQGAAGLDLVTWILMPAWTGDILDGQLARRSRVKYTTWVGEHDLHFDMLICITTLIYMLMSGFIILPVAAVYLLVWALIFWRWGVTVALGDLFMSPIYAWLLVVVFRETVSTRWWLLAFLLIGTILNWTRFAKQLVPKFFAGLRDLWTRDKRRES